MRESLDQYQIWFITGSQHLYGEETLHQVAVHAQEICGNLDANDDIKINVIYKGVVTTSDAIRQICLAANSEDSCVGVITWMHTFSPAKMWIAGIQRLHKPLLHFHTQYNRDIPWRDIDMDFMNLNQTAHGGREFGFISTRLGLKRKVVVGHWMDELVQAQVRIWTQVCAAWADCQDLKIARFGDNMREVAVTEGNKVSAQMQFGYQVSGYGLGDLVSHIDSQTEKEITRLVEEYQDLYDVSLSLQFAGARHDSLRMAAKIELGLRSFLQSGEFKAFTDTFENLHGLDQLPGIAVQRLMHDGYGFAAEGDWKTAALVRSMKVMAMGQKGGTSFMEDYTYHFGGKKPAVLGAHMLEICSSITDDRPRCEIHPLSIGGKADPIRLIFNARPGPALNASLIDLGNRFRLLVNEVEAILPPEDLPNLPVARVLWNPAPDLRTAAASWIFAGGAHHTAYSDVVTREYLEDFADISGIELVVIDAETRQYDLKQTLRWNDAYYQLKSGIR